MICPILQRYRMARPGCDFPDECSLPHVCIWAQFHELDPQTGKPPEPRPTAQPDLFAEAT